MMEGPVNSERRRYPRFGIDSPVLYSKEEEFNTHYGRAVNVSEEGLLMYSRDQLDIDQHLKSKIFFLLGSEFNAIEMEAQVVWTDLSLNEVWGDYRSGLRLIGISAENMLKLRRFLGNLSQ